MSEGGFVIVHGPSGWRRFLTLAYWRMLLTIGRPVNIVQTMEIRIDPESELGKMLESYESAE